MGNWSLYGILLGIGVFFGLLTFILSQIDVVNPLTGGHASVLSLILSWIIP